MAINHFLADVERRAFRMAQLATGNADDSLDLVQDAMLDFARRYALKPEGEWPALFYRVLQSRITDWHRRATVRNRFRVWFRSRNDEDEGEDPFSKVADPSPDPSRMLMSKVSGEAIMAALRTLSLRQQQAFLLRSWEGLDVAQTAFAMGCSEGSVKTHYSRAVHSLQRLLEEYRP